MPMTPNSTGLALPDADPSPNPYDVSADETEVGEQLAKLRQAPDCRAHILVTTITPRGLAGYLSHVSPETRAMWRVGGGYGNPPPPSVTLKEHVLKVRPPFNAALYLQQKRAAMQLAPPPAAPPVAAKPDPKSSSKGAPTPAVFVYDLEGNLKKLSDEEFNSLRGQGKLPAAVPSGGEPSHAQALVPNPAAQSTTPGSTAGLGAGPNLAA